MEPTLRSPLFSNPRQMPICRILSPSQQFEIFRENLPPTERIEQLYFAGNHRLQLEQLHLLRKYLTLTIWNIQYLQSVRVEINRQTLDKSFTICPSIYQVIPAISGGRCLKKYCVIIWRRAKECGVCCVWKTIQILSPQVQTGFRPWKETPMRDVSVEENFWTEKLVYQDSSWRWNILSNLARRNESCWSNTEGTASIFWIYYSHESWSGLWKEYV